MHSLFCLAGVLCGLTLAAPAAASTTPAGMPEPARLVARLRTAYSQPTTFAPSDLRFPPRLDFGAELARMRKAVPPGSSDLEARRGLALLAEEAEDPSAGEEWTKVLALVEAAHRKKPNDERLLEWTVEAMVGADVGLRAVPLAQKLAALRPKTWRPQLLLGDAHFRRADHHWRVLLRLSRGQQPLPAQFLSEMNADLKAAETAYDRAVELAPGEPAPRSGRITLRFVRPLMAGLLPAGSIPASEAPELASVRRELLEMVRKSPGRIDTLWHTARFLANSATAVTPQELKELESAVEAARKAGAERMFLTEAEGWLALARRDWSAARAAFDAVIALAPRREAAADWLAVAEGNSSEPRKTVLARIEARLKAAPRAQDWTLKGIVLADEDREAAVEALRKAISLDVDSAVARYNLAVLLLQGRPESLEARHHLTRAMEIRGDEPEAQFALLVVLALDKDLERSRQGLEGLLKRTDLDPGYRKRLEETLKDLSPN